MKKYNIGDVFNLNLKLRCVKSEFESNCERCALHGVDDCNVIVGSCDRFSGRRDGDNVIFVQYEDGEAPIIEMQRNTLYKFGDITVEIDTDDDLNPCVNIFCKDGRIEIDPVGVQNIKIKSTIDKKKYE